MKRKKKTVFSVRDKEPIISSKLIAREIFALNIFCELGSFKKIAEHSSITPYEAKKNLRSALQKLKHDPVLLEQWVDDPLIQVIKISQASKLRIILNAPLIRHGFPTQLYNSLHRMGCYTLKDVLEYRLSTISCQRGMGKKSIERLTSFLKAHNCLYLLKP